MLLPWHQIEIKRLLKVCGLGETSKKTRNTIACKITLKTLSRRLIFSSSFVFDMSFETGITMSQSRRHIRTVTNTWHKKVRQSKIINFWRSITREGHCVRYVSGGWTFERPCTSPARQGLCMIGERNDEDRMRATPLTMKATEAAGQWN